MTSITFKTFTTASGGRAIEATTGANGAGGSAEVSKGALISWQASVNGEVFRVVFADLSNSTAAIWPFKLNGANGAAPDGHDAMNRPYLQVDNQTRNRKLRNNAPANIVYKVSATSPQNVDPLDPVIIIRPNFSANVSVTAGVSAFVGGLIGGIVATSLRQ